MSSAKRCIATIMIMVLVFSLQAAVDGGRLLSNSRVRIFPSCPVGQLMKCRTTFPPTGCRCVPVSNLRPMDTHILPQHTVVNGIIWLPSYVEDDQVIAGVSQEDNKLNYRCEQDCPPERIQCSEVECCCM